MFFLWYSNIWRYIEKIIILTLLRHLNNLISQLRFSKKIQDYFAGYFCGNINQCISKLMFPPDLKLADVIPVHKNKSKTSKDDYKPLSFLSNYQIFMKDGFMIKFKFSPIIFCPISVRVSKRLQCITLLDNFNWEMEEKCW